jgi:hypothetical protein
MSVSSNPKAQSSITGSIYGTQPLLSNAVVTTTLLGNVNPYYHYGNTDYNLDGYFLANETPIASLPKVITSSTGAIKSRLLLLSNVFTINAVQGDIKSTQTLLSNAQVNVLAKGNAYSMISLFSYSHSQALSSARLSFPSIWIGKLSIIPHRTNYEIRTLT